ncbi:transketolase [Desulfonatronovibrio hydrogenovorans]|uniref:transketolase n=1 Tax=Desulfonatronovibrio hydrogenovorans TaxID=53245 RepID=UPI00048F04D0|nr:transketolase [Desulfonatronovibrio hydrogenovorans]
MTKELDYKVVNIIKGLIMDGTRKADSGHPGGAMSSADYLYILFREFLDFNPEDDQWFNRDRFVLSAGHESMLLYSVLCMSGFLTLDDLKSFRQWGSRTPGHPEHHMTPGVEATTGPLGQGVGMSVGMAVAESFLRANLGSEICNHFTYVLASDGDLQEPISLGSAALAGGWGLGKLIVYYDSNKIQLAGPTDRADCSDYKKIFEAFCWQVIEIDGHDHDQIRKAITAAKTEEQRPTLIIGHTVMAKGSASLEGSEKTHGAPFSPEEISQTKARLSLPQDKEFYLPQDALDHFQDRFSSLIQKADHWKHRLDEVLRSSEEKTRFWNFIHAAPESRHLDFPDFEPGQNIATRKAFGSCLNALMDQLPNFLGGSADLDPSNQTVKFREGTGIFHNVTNPSGRYLPFGVREFPMGAILNGMALHGGVIGFGATFLVFSDYERNALRMAALQKLPVLHIFTHDSFYVGEDGPTHQPIEHISSLRLIPDFYVFRPADAVETKLSLGIALAQTKTPSALMLTRQGVPVLDLDKFPQVATGVEKGAYILKDVQDPEIIIIASGSEVHIAMEAASILAPSRIRVVSAPCLELFEAQDDEYKETILPGHVRKRFAIEAGRKDIWYRYVGLDGYVYGLDRFGESAPGKVLAEKFGFTAKQFAEFVKKRI